jgi:predicted dehydrogenase
MRFGILGTGRITRRLVADLQSTPGVTVTAIASRFADRAAWCGSQYGIAHTIEGYQTLIDSDLVDALYIALPPSIHAEWSIACAKAGKHFLCEKPLATTLEEAFAIGSAAAEANVRWLDATAWMHHSRTDAMKRFVGEGKLGELRHISAAVSFFEPFQDQDHRRDASLGGGCLLDLAWYAAGSAILAAGPVHRVYASTLLRDGAVFRVNAMLWLDKGVTATINCAYDTATRKWTEWAGDQAAIVCDDFTRPWLDRPARIWIHDRAGAVESHQYVGSQERAMIERLIGDEDLQPFHEQAYRTQATLDAMIRSAQSQAMETVSCV